jgi:hypothetical protein
VVDPIHLYSAAFAKKEDNATRVRAFFYGEQSNLAEQTTDADPARETPR